MVSVSKNPRSKPAVKALSSWDTKTIHRTEGDRDNRVKVSPSSRQYLVVVEGVSGALSFFLSGSG